MAKATKKAPAKRAPKGRVVEAVGVASNSTRPHLAARVQAAMAAAAEKANANAITDPDEIRALMLKARASVKADNGVS